MNDRPSPISHTVGNIDVHYDARLHPFAELEHRGFTHRGIDVVVIESVDAEGKNNRFALPAPSGDGGDMESRSFVSFTHVTGPLRMKVESALDTSLFRLSGFVPAITRVEITFEHNLSVGHSQSIDTTRFYQPYRSALNRACHTDFIATLRKDDIVEAGAGHQCAGWRQAKIHRNRDQLVLFVVFRDDLPTMRTGGNLESSDIAPTKVHPVVA